MFNNVDMQVLEEALKEGNAKVIDCREVYVYGEEHITRSINMPTLDFLSHIDLIKKKEVDMIGIYRLTMKKDSDNMRDSSIFGVIQRLKDKGKKVMIYEPLIKETLLDGMPVFHNIGEFKRLAGLVVCNRMEPELIDIKHKVYTRDIFSSDT